MRRGELVPVAAPRHRELERHVGEVVRRAVGVAEPVVVRELVLAPDRVAVRDPIRPDGAGVAHVDHPRVGDVDRHPEGDQHHRDEADPLHGQRRAQALATAEADPGHAREQIGERGIDERNRDADLAAVEEHVRDAEREQHQEIEMRDSQRPAEVEEADEEDQREREPDVGRVEHVPELALVTPGHRPGDLVAGPGLDDRPRMAVDLDLDDLAVAALVADLPQVVIVHLDRGLRARRGGRSAPRPSGRRWRSPPPRSPRR